MTVDSSLSMSSLDGCPMSHCKLSIPCSAAFLLAALAFHASVRTAVADEPEAAARSPLQGTWKLVSVESKDGMADLPDPRPTVEIDKSRLLYGGEEVATVAVAAEGELKSFDLTMGKPKRTFEGVYVLEKEVLTVCLNGQTDGVKERPTSVSIEGHPAWRLLKFEQIKPEDAVPGKGYVGMALRHDNDHKDHILIAAIIEDSPASKADLQKDDQIVRINGEAPGDLMQAVNAVRKAKPGTELIIVIYRNDKEREIKIKVGLFPLRFLLGLE
jgi:uncharacterized protein (TIGR03067 family)